MTLHFVTDSAPLSKAAIRLMVGRLAGRIALAKRRSGGDVNHRGGHRRRRR